MGNTVKERLKEIIKDYGIKDSDFCREIGVSQGFISGMRKSIQPNKIERIAEIYPTWNTEWILTGKGSMYKSKQEDSELNLTDDNSLKYYYELDATASNIEDLTDNELNQPFRRLYIPGYEGTIGFTVTGESMLPTLKPRDIVAVSREMVETIINGEMYLVVTRDGQRMVKRLVLNGVDEDGVRHIKCVSDNPNQELYAPFEILGDNIHTISRVRGYISYSSL
ncbi:helix-turn-helix transcriptional regulator [Bacteroides sp. KG123]|uniref:LexA family transcriptional regulator n=1 Tax=Bacteroides TaxID=816 RepID=UPI003AF142D7